MGCLQARKVTQTKQKQKNNPLEDEFIIQELQNV